MRTAQAEWVEIIGVVAHQRQTSLAEPGREQVYFSDAFMGYGAAGWGAAGRWAIRTTADPSVLVNAARAEIAAVSRARLVNDARPMTAVVEQAQAGTRFSLLLIGAFAAIAALLAAVGLYGVLSTVVRQRTVEIGIRMALGAQRGNIFGLVISHGLALSATGLAGGLAAAFALTRLMTSMLVGIKPTDPLTFGVMVLVFLLLAGVAAWLPARRAAALEPACALRDE